MRGHDAGALARHCLYALGFGVAFSLTQAFDLVTPSSDAMYHSTMGKPSLVGGVLWMMALSAGCFFVLRMLLRRVGGKPVAQRALLISVPCLLVLANRVLIAEMLWRVRAAWHVPNAVDVVPVSRAAVAVFCVAWAALMLLVLRSAPRVFSALAGAGKLLLLCSGMLGIFMLVHAGEAYARRRGEQNTAAWQQPTDAQPPRIVWIVLDEMSDKYAWEQRPPGVKLPALDSFARQSTVFTHTAPIGLFTDVVLPSLLLGEQVNDVGLDLHNQASFQRDEDDQYVDWNPGQSVLGDAESAGWNVAIDGWWNPYCSLYAAQLQRCFWTYNRGYSAMREDRSAWQNAGRGFAAMLRPMRGPAANQARLDELDQIMSRAGEYLADDRLDLVLVHVPAPHHPYTFDRATGVWSAAGGKSYADGLAGADQLLGKLLAEAQRSPRWVTTTVIVHGDHSWRTQLWTHEPGWTSEDERLSDGRAFDDRPLLLVHLPRQTEGAVYSAPVSLMLVHDIVAAEIKTNSPPDVDDLAEDAQPQ